MLGFAVYVLRVLQFLDGRRTTGDGRRNDGDERRTTMADAHWSKRRTGDGRRRTAAATMTTLTYTS